MEIRLAQEADIKRMLEVFQAAKAYMIAHGNPTQWGDGYPEVDLLREDIRKEQSYVMLKDGEIVATFVFIIGEDPTYRVIEGGQWLSDQPYGIIHRIASDGSANRIFENILKFCEKKIAHIRIDTHRDNLTMQNVIEKYDFQYCGIIYVRDHSPRLAYERCQ